MFVDTKASGEVQVSTVKTNLMKAAEILQRRGQCRFRFIDGKGSICMTEAITRAVLGQDPDNGIQCYSRLMGLIISKRQEFACMGGIDGACACNNSHTLKQCVAKLREAANSYAG